MLHLGHETVKLPRVGLRKLGEDGVGNGEGIEENPSVLGPASQLADEAAKGVQLAAGARELHKDRPPALQRTRRWLLLSGRGRYAPASPAAPTTPTTASTCTASVDGGTGPDVNGGACGGSCGGGDGGSFG